jgi:hypothetical protein
MNPGLRMAIRGLGGVYKILSDNGYPPLFFFRKPCNHSLLYLRGGLPLLPALRGCQETLPGV